MKMDALMKHLKKIRLPEKDCKRECAQRIVTLYERYTPLRHRVQFGTINFDDAYAFVDQNLNKYNLHNLNNVDNNIYEIFQVITKCPPYK